MAQQDHLLFVGCYNAFENLAHAPRGTPSAHSILTVELNNDSGELKPTHALSGLLNPAFLRHHPAHPILYAATESIDAPGSVVGMTVSDSGKLTPFCEESAKGASTCYLTLTPDSRNLLFVNYWDSSMGVLAVDLAGRVLPGVRAMQPPPAPIRAGGLADHLANRQSEPHAHAIVLDPSLHRLAFVPDLGLDVIHFYVYDHATETLTQAGSTPSAPPDPTGHGPRYVSEVGEVGEVGVGGLVGIRLLHRVRPAFRYIEFGRGGEPVAYVVNELSSTVSVFRFSASIAAEIVADPSVGAHKSPLELVQLVSTRAASPPATKNTCGRIAIHPGNECVLVSNRGDDTIASFAIKRDPAAPGSTPTLAPAQIVSTQGKTPRHFQFTAGGRYIVVANQDSDSLASFRFDSASAGLAFTGYTCACSSPSFVCATPPPRLEPTAFMSTPSSELESF